MKAMIFAAGLGTRLRPITDTMPKALVPVGGKPVLQYVIEHIKSVGISEMVINVHHFPEQICQFLDANDNFGINIAISDESERLLDTGGGLLMALPLLGDNEPVLLHNADIITDAPLQQMVEFHLNSGADASLLSWNRNSSRKLLFSVDGMMQGWMNMSTGETRPNFIDESNSISLAFGGVHIVNPSIFPALKEFENRRSAVFSMTPFYIEYCSKFLIQRFTPSEPFNWFDIGRPESLANATEFVLSTK